MSGISHRIFSNSFLWSSLNCARYRNDWYKAFAQPNQFIFYFQWKLIKEDFIDQSMFNQLAKLRIKYTAVRIGMEFIKTGIPVIGSTE